MTFRRTFKLLQATAAAVLTLSISHLADVTSYSPSCVDPRTFSAKKMSTARTAAAARYNAMSIFLTSTARARKMSTSGLYVRPAVYHDRDLRHSFFLFRWCHFALRHATATAWCGGPVQQEAFAFTRNEFLFVRSGSGELESVSVRFSFM